MSNVTTITYPNGRTYNASKAQTLAAWDRFLKLADAWETAEVCTVNATEFGYSVENASGTALVADRPAAILGTARRPATRERMADLRDVATENAIGHNRLSWDPTDYGNGMDGDTLEIEETIEGADRAITALEFELRAIPASVKNRIELAKAGRVARFSWRDAWSEAKEEMRDAGRLLRLLRSERAAAAGELRAREADANPAGTRWFTADLPGAASGDDFDNPVPNFADVPDADYNGAYAASLRGNPLAPCPAARATLRDMADPIRRTAKRAPAVRRRRAR